MKPTHKHILNTHEAVVLNELTEARDFCCTERNFCSSLKMVLALTVVAADFFLRVHVGRHPVANLVWGSFLFSFALVAVVAGSWNYVTNIGRYAQHKRHVYTSKIGIMTMVVLCALALAMNIYQLIIRPKTPDRGRYEFG